MTKKTIYTVSLLSVVVVVCCYLIIDRVMTPAPARVESGDEINCLNGNQVLEKKNSIATSSTPPEPSKAYRKKLEEDFFNALQRVEDGRANSNVIEEKPRQNMISKEQAIDSAKQKWHKKLHNRSFTATLIDRIYVVECWKPDNPFREIRLRDFISGIDAVTGEFISSGKLDGGMQFYSLDKNTRQSEEKIKRLQPIIQLLDERASEGQELNSERTDDMITPEQALEVAKEKVKERAYCREKEPLPVLVDDVYMVVFWRPEGSYARHHKKKYDSRVAIDAYTGEYIGTEITKEP